MYHVDCSRSPARDDHNHGCQIYSLPPEASRQLFADDEFFEARIRMKNFTSWQFAILSPIERPILRIGPVAAASSVAGGVHALAVPKVGADASHQFDVFRLDLCSCRTVVCVA